MHVACDLKELFGRDKLEIQYSMHSKNVPDTREPYKFQVSLCFLSFGWMINISLICMFVKDREKIYQNKVCIKNLTTNLKTVCIDFNNDYNGIVNLFQTVLKNMQCQC